MIDLVEFPADDLDRAQLFWQGVLGVELEARREGEGTGIQTHVSGAELGLHVRGSGPGDRVSLPYFSVTDLAASLERVVELGGDVIHPGERWAICRDSEASPFGLRAVDGKQPDEPRRRGRLLETYDAATWGDHLADVYEEWLATTGVETDAAVERLAELAGGGPVLELAVGTGRIALPLAERGLDVHGVDGSERMAAKLRARPGGDRIPVAIGDFADVPIEGLFRLIFVVFNTFLGLITQEDQVRCFQNVAEHLTDDGVFVIEAEVPPSRLKRESSIDVWKIEADRVMLGFERTDPVTQTSEQMEVWITEEGIRMFPNPTRYASPAELDLMARLAGLELRDRWANWRQEPFTGKSPSHVSVYARTGL
jgi:predicted enzyme related to lactoylglutathione lyase/SAM-dependent methyltransferase